MKYVTRVLFKEGKQMRVSSCYRYVNVKVKLSLCLTKHHAM